MDKPVGPVVGISIGRRIISEFQRRREAEGRVWADGYSQGELDDAQDRFGLVFPPDLIALFLDRRPVLAWDWRTDHAEIRHMLGRPYEGLLFDIEHNALWWPEWGDRPAQAAGRADVLRSVIGRAPKLVPLLSHRFLPSEPNEAGNPVFSIHQSDVIYYGSDIVDYFDRELGGVKSGQPINPARRIPFWSELVERNVFLWP